MIKDGKGNLSVPCYCINLFYGYRDEDVHACAGMGEGEECFPGGVIILRLLFWPLGGICIGCDLPAKAF